MKRFAYSLIGISSLWFAIIAAQPENTYDDYYADRPAWGKAAGVTSVIALLFFPVAGWILAGTSHPKEAWPHKLIMAFAALAAGVFFCAFIMMGAMALRDWLWPLPPVPEKD